MIDSSIFRILLSTTTSKVSSLQPFVKNLFPSKIQAACSLLERRLLVGSVQHRCLISNKRDHGSFAEASLIKRERAKQYNNNLYNNTRHQMGRSRGLDLALPLAGLVLRSLVQSVVATSSSSDPIRRWYFLIIRKNYNPHVTILRTWWSFCPNHVF